MTNNPNKIWSKFLYFTKENMNGKTEKVFNITNHQENDI